MIRLMLCLSLLGTLTFSNPATAQRVEADTVWFLAGGYQDFGALGASPLRAGKTNWKVWAGIGAGVGLSFLADRPYQRFYNRNFGPDDWPNQIGEGLSFSGRWTTVLGANLTWALAGVLAKNERAVQTGAIGIEAQVLAGFFALELKTLSGRDRPDEGLTWHGPPTSLDEWGNRFDQRNSFPSGHAFFAWSWASGVAWAYRDTRWVPAVAYGYASLVSVGRLAQNEHWVSDVAVGSALGYGLGRYLMKRRWGTAWTILPSGWRNNWQVTGLYRF